MSYKDPEKERLRGVSRRAYFKEYRRKHPQTYKSHGDSMGYKGELLGLKVLVGSKRINRPCDLSWRGKLVDVKTAKPTLTKLGIYRWKFLLSQINIADLFLLIRKDDDDKIIDIYLIPGNKIKNKNISFNNKTAIKYSKYLLSL